MFTGCIQRIKEQKLLEKLILSIQRDFYYCRICRKRQTIRLSFFNGFKIKSQDIIIAQLEENIKRSMKLLSFLTVFQKKPS